METEPATHSVVLIPEKLYVMAGETIRPLVEECIEEQSYECVYL